MPRKRKEAGPSPKEVWAALSDLCLDAFLYEEARAGVPNSLDDVKLRQIESRLIDVCDVAKTGIAPSMGIEPLRVIHTKLMMEILYRHYKMVVSRRLNADQQLEELGKLSFIGDLPDAIIKSFVMPLEAIKNRGGAPGTSGGAASIAKQMAAKVFLGGASASLFRTLLERDKDVLDILDEENLKTELAEQGRIDSAVKEKISVELPAIKLRNSFGMQPLFTLSKTLGLKWR